MTKVQKLIKEGAPIEAIVAYAVQAERKKFKSHCLKMAKQARRQAKAAVYGTCWFEYYSGILKAADDLAALIK